MFKERFISGTILALLAIAALTIGGPALAIILCIISVIGFYELAKATGVHDVDKKLNVAEELGIVCIAIYYLVTYFEGTETHVLLVVVFSMVAFMAMYVITFPRFHINQIMALYFSFMYAPVMLSFIYMTRQLEHGNCLAWMILISAWGSDTFAYAVGMITGKTVGNHKIFPKLSPKKSLEGCIGGVVGTALAGALFGYVFVSKIYPGVSTVWSMALIGASGSIISQIGDLAASAIKRNHNIKDYGKLIPGHGGIMDRFDSVIYTAPMIYFLTVMLIL